MRILVRVAGVLASMVLLAGARASADASRDDAPAPCWASGDTVMVIARKRELWLCHDGMPRGPISVALGRGGIDKHHEGDGRTPVGTYTLGTPRESDQFGIFIPIDYPTADQLALGYTGGAIGIHGPPRGPLSLEHWTTVFDWTLGCIATGSDEDLYTIVAFVIERQPLVVIR